MAVEEQNPKVKLQNTDSFDNGSEELDQFCPFRQQEWLSVIGYLFVTTIIVLQLHYSSTHRKDLFLEFFLSPSLPSLSLSTHTNTYA